MGTPLGGIINFESERPNEDLGGYVAMLTGSYGTENPSFDLTGRLTSAINARLSGDYQRNDSWLDKIHG